jgi:hypothetical protein
LWKRKKAKNKQTNKTNKQTKKQTQCFEIEPNPSKDGAMNDGDNPLFWQFIWFTFFLTFQFIFIF